MKNKALMIIFILFLWASNLISEGSTVGSKLLNLKSSARINALGSYFTSLYGDINAMEENPSGTTFARSLNFNLSVTRWIGEINFLNFKTIIPAGFRKLDPLNILFTTTLLLYPEVEHFDESGSKVGIVDLVEGYTGLGASTIFFDFLQTGIMFKYTYRSIYEKYYSSLTADIGIQFPYVFKTSVMYMGVVLKNVGYDFEGSKLPASLLLGVNYSFFDEKLLTKFDFGTEGLNNASDIFTRMIYSLGIEYDIYSIMALRIGVKYRNENFHPTFGLGLQDQRLNKYNLYFAVDYAYAPLFDIEEYHNHQVTIKFVLFTGKEKREKVLLFEKYRRVGMLYYLKGEYKLAIENWEKALKYGSSEELEGLVERTEQILERRKETK
ncbi:MAG: hypothetical protein JW827_01955 [Spirochaetes bacterium]|nr:hypothetical protein [Spirochaetota bacterium]